MDSITIDMGDYKINKMMYVRLYVCIFSIHNCRRGYNKNLCTYTKNHGEERCGGDESLS